jgi:hypothetical protein
VVVGGKHEADADFIDALSDLSGVRLMLTPSASRTSALPDCDETDRPPCLATRAPAAAATNIAAVEMLKVWAPSPPVPQVSTRWAVTDLHLGRQLAHDLRRSGDFTDRFLLDAQADDDRRNHHRRDFAAHDLAHQRNHLVVKDFAVFDHPRQASWGFIGRCSSRKFFKQIVAALGQDRFRVELDPSTASVLWRRPMISPSSVQAVISRQAGRDAFDGQRMIARAGQWTGQATERRPGHVCLTGDTLPCIRLGCAWTTRPPKASPIA